MRQLHLAAILTAIPPAAEERLAAAQLEAHARLDVLAAAVRMWAEHESKANDALQQWPIFLFLASAMMCLGLSALYHLLGTANAAWANLLGALDLAGVTGLIVGSFVPLLSLGFHEHPEHRRAYTAFMCTLGTVVLTLTPTRAFLDEKYRALRTFLFVALGFAGAVPLTHLLVLRGGGDDLAGRVAFAAARTGALYLFGTAFYLGRFPERFAPGRFDNFLPSHAIWHMIIVAAACAHYASVMDLYLAVGLAHDPLAAPGGVAAGLAHPGIAREAVTAKHPAEFEAALLVFAG